MSSWYLIYTKPKGEDAVTTRLSNAGFETLNPKIIERKFLRMKAADRVSQLFPCYVFARFDKHRDYHLIRYTRGVKFVLGNENGPSEVDDGVVASIRLRMDEDGLIRIRNSFAAGQTVIVKGGPFEGFSAIFEREMSGLERVSVLLSAINVRLVVDKVLIAAG